MRETAVEKRLMLKVRKAGGICMKVMPVVAGYPDRLVLLPGGRLFLIETKAPRGRLEPIQRVFIQRAKAIGVEVAVLYDSAQVDAWVADRMAEEDDFSWLVGKLVDHHVLSGDRYVAALLEKVEARTGQPNVPPTAV